MDANGRELILQKVMIKGFSECQILFAFIRVHSWLTGMQDKIANAH
jgi:hypothetical protein